MKMIHGRDLFQQLQRLFPSIPDRCTHVTVVVGVDQAVQVTCTFCPEAEVDTTTKVFDLVPVEQEGEDKLI